jgi:hypothetical protein
MVSILIGASPVSESRQMILSSEVLSQLRPVEAFFVWNRKVELLSRLGADVTCQHCIFETDR